MSILCMRHITDESAAIFSQPPTREIASIREKPTGTEASLRASGACISARAINYCL